MLSRPTLEIIPSLKSQLVVSTSHLSMKKLQKNKIGLLHRLQLAGTPAYRNSSLQGEKKKKKDERESESEAGILGTSLHYAAIGALASPRGFLLFSL